MVPRNTSIIVRRLPASRPGKGTAQRYVLGALDSKGPGTMKTNPSMAAPTPSFNPGHRNLVLNNTQHQQQPQAMQIDTVDQQNNSIKDDSEEARIQAMFQQTTDQWGVMQEKLAE